MKQLKYLLFFLRFMANLVAASPLPVGSKFAKTYEYLLDLQNYTLEVKPNWEHTTFPKWDSIVTYCH